MVFSGKNFLFGVCRAVAALRGTWREDGWMGGWRAKTGFWGLNTEGLFSWDVGVPRWRVGLGVVAMMEVVA